MGVIPQDTILAAANPGVPKWSELSDDERRFCERSQEVYAGFIDHTDQQIGRLVSFLEARGQIENTLIVLLSDNGASPEGGPLGTVALNARKHLYHGPETAEERREAIDRLGDKTTFPHYAFGWAQTSNTPLKWYKMNTYGGGVRSPLIMHWPAKIKAGALQTQFHHAIDVVPTVLDALNIKAPESYHGIPQMPVQGVSMRYSFNAAERADTQGLPVLRTGRRPRDLASGLEGRDAPQQRHGFRRRSMGAASAGSGFLGMQGSVAGAP